jgi:hypothetical protein
MLAGSIVKFALFAKFAYELSVFSLRWAACVS